MMPNQEVSPHASAPSGHGGQSRPSGQGGHNRRNVVIAALLILLIGALLMVFWPRQAAPTPAQAIPVNAGHPLRQDFPIRVVQVGNVQALNTVDVKVRVDGQLQRVAFVEGQDVAKGQLLAQLDQGPLKAQLNQAQATQRKDEASLANAKLDLARYTKLVGIGAATTQSVDSARAQVDVDAATVAADAALVRNDALQLGFTTLTSPFAGRVGQREADVGAIVHPTDTTGLVTVTQMEPIDVLFSVPQSVLPELLAQQANAPLPVHVSTATGGTSLADGSLVFVDSQVDSTTGQIKVKASFANRDRKLWPGELINASVLLRTDRQQVAIPARAVVNTQTGSQVYVIAANGTVALRTVTTGATVDGMTEVHAGVAVTDTVVFDGQSRLNPGSHVKATMLPATPTAPGTSSDATGATTVSAPT